MVAIAAFFQQASYVSALVKTVQSKLGAGHVGSHVNAAKLRVLRHVFAPLADLLLPLRVTGGFLLAHMLFDLAVQQFLPGGLFRILPGILVNTLAGCCSICLALCISSGLIPRSFPVGGIVRTTPIGRTANVGLTAEPARSAKIGS